MHEYSIVQALLEQVCRQVDHHAAKVVHRIKVRLGALSGVEPDLFTTAFDMARAMYPSCSTAQLDVVSSPAVWECPRCHAEFKPKTKLWCEKCHTPARLVRGDEIILEQIEMELANVQ